MKKIIAITLSLLMLLSVAIALNIGSSAYSAGEVILDESKINDATKIAANIKDKIGTSTITWNETTGRLHVKAPGQGAIEVGTDFAPTTGDAFTLSGDIYLKGSGGGTPNQGRVGLGVYSDYGTNATGWTNGCYVWYGASGPYSASSPCQLYFEHSPKLTQTQKAEYGSTYAKGASIGTASEYTDYAKSVSFKLVVDPSAEKQISAYLDDALVATISNEITAELSVGKCFIFVRNSEFEIDNLKITYDAQRGDGSETQKELETTKPMTLPSEPDKVYYPNGTIILNEDMIKADVAGNVQSATVSDTSKYSFTWNDTTGKLQMTSTGGNMVAELVKVPAGLDNYTITGKFTMISNEYGNKAMMGLGINSAKAWSRSSYVSAQIYNNGDLPKVYVDSFKIDGTAQAGDSGRGNITMDKAYVYGETEYTFKIIVEPNIVTYWCNDEYIAMSPKDALPYPANVPTIILRDKCTIEIDDLMVYSGSGDPDPSKVIGEVDPIPEPESATSPDTTAPETTAAPGDDDNETTEKADVTNNDAATEADTEEESSGCGSAVGVGVLAISTAVCAVGVVLRRKRRLSE